MKLKPTILLLCFGIAALSDTLSAQASWGALPENQRIFKLDQDTGRNTSQGKKKDPNARAKVDEITFLIRMPVSWTEEAAKTAKTNGKFAVRGVLAICTFVRYEVSMRPFLVAGNDKFGHLIKFADDNDLAVVTWTNFRGYDKSLSSDEMLSGQYQEYEKNFMDRLGEWERGFKRILSHYNLPSNSMMVYGISGGAQMAHRIVLRRPDYFSAIHMHVNSSYDTPTGAAQKVLWMVTTGENEYGYEAGKRFYSAMIEKQYAVIFKAGENLGHSDREDIRNLSLEFFKYALAFIPDARDKNWRAPPVDKFYMMRYPVYVGDYLNHIAYSPKEAEGKIAQENMVALPTKPIAEAWGTIVAPRPSRAR